MRIRAYVLTGPGQGAVQLVPAPVPTPGEVVVEVERVGVCGTDVEFFTGEMAYLHQGHASYPMRLGHEWAGTVSAVGAGVDPGWVVEIPFIGLVGRESGICARSSVALARPETVGLASMIRGRPPAEGGGPRFGTRRP